VFGYCCITCIVLSIGASIAPAQATRPAAAPPPSPAELYDLHVQAVKFMRANQFDKAKPLLEKVYVQTGAGQRSRALVLNRAIMDLAQRPNVSRGVRELTAYLTAHAEPPDELAINILGASLNLMAERYNGKRNPVWQASLAEWDRQNARLEQTRPGMHRWGVEWLDEDKFARIQIVRDRAAKAISDQAEAVRIAQADLLSAQQRRGAFANLQQQSGLAPEETQALATAKEAARREREKARAAGGASSTISVAGTPGTPLVGTDGTNLDQITVQAEVVNLDRHLLPALQQRVADETVKLQDLQNSQQMRPEWPARFDPIDPEPLAVATALSTTTRPVAASTQPVSSDPLAQAIALIKGNDLVKARAALDVLWKATPPEQRSRALLLNRAMVDLGDRRFVIRAVRDLSDYLTAHPQRDEQATDILAAALNNSAYDRKVKSGPIWQNAWKEWARRNEELDQSRPGFRRWGAQWLTDEQYAALKERQTKLEEAIREQASVVDADLRRAGAIAQAMSVQEFIDQSGDMTGVHTNSRNKTVPPGFYDKQSEYIQNLSYFYDANGISNRAKAEAQANMTKLRELAMKREVPTWPTSFAPVEPTQPAEGPQ
jgi:hypothetical protein